MRHSRTTARGCLAIAAALGLAACGASPADRATEPSTTVRYGTEGDARSDETTTVPPAPAGSAVMADQAVEDGVAPAAAPPASAPVTTTRGPRVPNRTERVDPSGFRLTFVTADKIEFSSAEDIVFELRFENVGPEVRYIHSDQQQFFALAAPTGGEPPWVNDEDRCLDPPPPPIQLAIPVEPGSGNRFVRRYPAEAGNPRREQCRVPPGTYAAHAFLEWCPDATPDRRRCTAADARRIDAEPIEITIVGPAPPS